MYRPVLLVPDELPRTPWGQGPYAQPEGEIEQIAEFLVALAVTSSHDERGRRDMAAGALGWTRNG